MSFISNYRKELAKLKAESADASGVSSGFNGTSTGSSFMSDYRQELANISQKQNVAPVGFGSVSSNVTGRMTTNNKKKKKKEEEEERKWFQKGLFEDGYDLGDISKTILGTVTDTAENVGAGIMGMGEKAIDALAWMAPAMENAAFYQNGGGYNLELEKAHKEAVEESKKGINDFIAKDLYDEEAVAKAIITNPVQKISGVNVEDTSVFGEKSDALIQSAGQLAAQYGLTAVGVPWFVTSGLTSFGGETENALRQGASHEEAGASAAISAGAEVLSEKLFGGDLFVGKSGSDLATSYLSRAISNKALRTMAKLGIDSAGESFEEVFSEAMGNLGSALYKEENLGEILFSEEALEGYLEAAIGGGVLGGAMGGINAVQSGKAGKDFTSGLTANEETVVQKVYNDRVSEAEKNGKISQKEKTKIYDQVVSEMDKGYLSIDDIESALGGKTYEDYKKVSEWEDSLQEEYNELHKMKRGDMTGEQLDREAELKKQLENVKATSGRDVLKSQLGEEVFGLVKGSRLTESYNERTRRGQKFEADLTQYDAKQQGVIQKAIDSGILNNTNRTHEFVDIIAKISADKGVLFDFTNNARLKESGFAIEGKQVNGFVNKDGITLNIDSSKAWQKTVGHEVTHVLEGTELYTELQNTLIEYAKSKGEYDSRYQSLTELYKDIEDANIDNELTADLVGEYLFTDEDFIKNLSVNNRNVFQKIYDEIKYLAKVATGSKEARELEKVKRAFEAAYKETGKDLNDTKYSISSDGKQLTKEQQEFFKDSKMRDENGNLKVMYHGSQNAGFHVFDPKMSDDDTSLFFVDRNEVAASYSGTSETYEAKTIRTAEDMNNFLAEIGYDHYEAVEKDGKFELLEDGDHVATSDTAQGIYEEFCWYEGVGDGDANYKVYLNLTNPLEVDARGRNWNNISREFSQEVYDRYQSLTEAEREALVDVAEWGEYSIFRDELLTVARAASERKLDDASSILASAYKKLGGANANLYDAFTIASDNFSEETLREFAVKQMNTRDYAQKAKAEGYDGVIFKNIHDNGGYSNGSEGASTVAIAFDSKQIKSVTNDNPTADPDIRLSLSKNGEQFGKTGQFATPATELRYEAPTTEENTVVAENETTTPTVSETETVVTAADMQELFPDDLAPVQGELERLDAHRKQLYGAMEVAIEHGSAEEVGKLAAEYEEVSTKIKALESEETDRAGSLSDADAPPEMDAPFYGESENETVENPFDKRDWYKVGNQKVKAYMYENPEVKPFFQEEAMNLLGELNDTQKGERWYNDDLHYESGGEKGWGGQKRLTSDSIETLLDGWGMSYADIEKGLNAIIEDNGAENIAAAKKIEFMLNDRLLNGYKDFYTNGRIEPNQDYINLLSEKQIDSYSKEAFDSLMRDAEMYAPYEEKPLKKATPDTLDAPVFESKDKNAVKGQTTMFAPEKPKTSGRVANVLTEEAKVDKKKTGIGSKIMAALVDKGWAVEKLSHETGNHELQAKYQAALPSTTEAKAQYFMENGADGVMSLKDIMKEVNRTGKTEDFFNYLYHRHNVDRMSLEARFGVPNKAVFGDSVTSEVSQRKAQRLESVNPEFKDMAEDIYAYNKHLRKLLVDSNVISQETADLWENMYPHYVPIRRVDDTGVNINVALDTNKTGVNAPVKRATGGSSDIQPLFETMAMRTEQTYRAIARNSFGLELKNTLGGVIESDLDMAIGVDEMIDTIEKQDDLLKPGTMKSNPTFTVFENGERVEFEITEDLFDALKPAGGLLGYRNKAITGVSEVRRNLLTTWNPVFALYRNPIKDIQDVAVNSQHPVKTYANIPKAIYQIATGGKWATEYHKNGGKSNTYFDSQSNKFKAEDSVFKKAIGMPLKALETAGEFIEEIPRLSEYIASREDGRSVERSMLDAARVTTNFAAGGDFAKFLNSHGFTFLNASVQGAAQHARNFREAKQQGLKGYVKVLAKYTVAGLPGILLNNLLWEDDEEYEELNDYVKQNYYVIAKTQDGKFVRIPKGRTAAVMQNAMEQMQHLITGDDEADFGTFYELFMNNIAPNNPIENNILSPIGQAMSNKAWYGDDLVPTRLQKLPAVEQFDESTDSISRWLGENTGISPYKINYLIDQYSGGVGDVFLPMLTPEAESGDNSLMGNIIAPWKKEMTTDSVLNNKNPGDFYELKDELEIMSNSKFATEEDRMRSVYVDSVSWEMSDLYAKKREIQSGDLPDDEKYEQVREIQEEINELAKNAIDNYNHVDINGVYAEAGDRRYNYSEDKDTWYEIKPQNSDGSDNWYYIQEKLSHDNLGMSYGDFWNGKNPPTDFRGKSYYGEYNGKRYNYDAEKSQWYEIRTKNDDGSDNWYYQMEQKVTKGLGISYKEYWSKPKEYNFAYEKPGRYAIAQAVGGYDTYKQHYDVLENWQSDSYLGADKDAYGNSISGSRKDKVIDYINGLDMDYGERIILYRTVYSSKADKRAYNQDIIDYLNERDDISAQEMRTILEELDFKVDTEGYITW